MLIKLSLRQDDKETDGVTFSILPIQLSISMTQGVSCLFTSVLFDITFKIDSNCRFNTQTVDTICIPERT
jgi:hypothetical protein